MNAQLAYQKTVFDLVDNINGVIYRMRNVWGKDREYIQYPPIGEKFTKLVRPGDSTEVFREEFIISPSAENFPLDDLRASFSLHNRILVCLPKEVYDKEDIGIVSALISKVVRREEYDASQVKIFLYDGISIPDNIQ